MNKFNFTSLYNKHTGDTAQNEEKRDYLAMLIHKQGKIPLSY